MIIYYKRLALIVSTKGFRMNGDINHYQFEELEALYRRYLKQLSRGIK